MEDNTTSKSRLQNYLLVVLLGGIGRLLALAREASSAYFFGVSADFGAFLIALSFISVVIIILDDMLTPFVTTNYADIQKKGNVAQARDFAGYILSGIALTISMLSIVIYFAAPWVVSIVVVGFSSELKESIVYLMRLLLPFFWFSCIVNFMGVIQQCQDKYTLMALNNSVVNIVFIAFVVFTTNYFGIISAIVGYNFAFLLLTILHYYAVTKTGIKFSFGNGSQIKLSLLMVKMKALSLWGCLSFFKNIEPFIDYLLVSFISASAMAVFSYASKVNILIYSLIISPFTSVYLPYLSRLAAEYDLQTFNKLVIQNLRLYMLLLLPVAGFTIIFRQEIIALFYQRGAFDVLAASDTSLTLAILSIGLPFLGILEVLKNAFAGQKKTGILICIYAIGFFLKLIIGMSLAKEYGIVSIAVANTSYIIILSTLLLLMYFKSARLGIDMIKSVIKTIVCVFFACASIWAFPGSKIMVGLMLYMFVFCAVAKMLRHEDFDNLINEVRQFMFARFSFWS